MAQGKGNMTQPGETTAFLSANPTDVQSIEIFIQSPDNRIISFNIESSDTIEYVKSLIYDKEKMDINKQILYFDDQKLDNSRTLSSYDISNQSALILKETNPTQMCVHDLYH